MVGRNFVGKSVFVRKKKLSEKEKCWKIVVRKKKTKTKNKFFSEKIFYQKQFLLKKIATNFVGDFVSHKSMFIFYSTYNKAL